MTALPRPAADELPDLHRNYVDQVAGGPVLDQLRRNGASTVAAIAALGDVGAALRYAKGKWSIKQVFGHVIDAERLFAHRALAIARRDPADQPGMDQEIWVDAAAFDDRTLASLCAEFRAVRAASLLLFESFSAAVGARRGRASGHEFTVRSLVWVTAGHEVHHRRVLGERYGVAFDEA